MQEFADDPADELDSSSVSSDFDMEDRRAGGSSDEEESPRLLDELDMPAFRIAGSAVPLKVALSNATDARTSGAGTTSRGHKQQWEFPARLAGRIEDGGGVASTADWRQPPSGESDTLHGDIVIL